MRVAVLSHHKSLGGGSRFVRGILSGLVEHTGDRVDELAVFLRDGAPEAGAIQRLAMSNANLKLYLVYDNGSLSLEGPGSGAPMPETVRDRLRRNRALVAAYRFAKFGILRRPCDVIEQPAPLPPVPQFELARDVLDALQRYDVVYVTWPRMLRPFSISRPLAATFHDFNQRHGFAVFSDEEREFIDAEVREWLSGDVQPVCSTPFIAEELERFYPERTRSAAVVYLSTFVQQPPGPEAIAEARRAYGLDDGYIICPTNVGPHKNVPRLLKAYGSLRRAGLQLPLVFTGGGTQMVGRDPSNEWLYHTPLKASIDAINAALAEEGLVLGSDVHSLGYVDDDVVDALIAGATLVVAPSLYEAGTGPGLDAWSVGTPVAVSHIAPVVQQLEFLGTRAVLFDPENPEEIAGAIKRIIDNPQQARRDAEDSRDAMAAYTWRDVASEYIDVFERMIGVARESGSPASMVE